MGHAGAFWEDGIEGAQEKINAWERIGIRTVGTPGDIAKAIQEVRLSHLFLFI
jgi:succinyl-CoA synthetase alpha subunit